MSSDSVDVLSSGIEKCVLSRPKSADNLQDHMLKTASHSLHTFEDLAESEVFVGDDEVSSIPEFDIHSELSSEHAPFSSTAITIAYHDETHRLDAVKEEVEAEEAEEASMNFSCNEYASHGPSSLVSSAFSSGSYDDIGLSFNESFYSPRLSSSRGGTPWQSSKTPKNNDICKVVLNNYTSPRGSPKRGLTNTAVFVSSSTVPRKASEEKKPLNSRSSKPVSRSNSLNLPAPKGCNACAVEKSRLEERCKSLLVKRVDSGHNDKSKEYKKVDHRHCAEVSKDDSSVDAKLLSSNRPSRRRKDQMIEKYGTFGRRCKLKVWDDDCKEKEFSLTKENKETLDKYATLPRRRAKEVSKKWKEEQELKSRSSVKIDSLSPGSKNAVRATGNSPPFSVTHLSTNGCHSGITRSNSVGITRRERTLIYAEAGVQTCLTGVDITSALCALSHHRLFGEGNSRVKILREGHVEVNTKEMKSVGIQADINIGDQDLINRFLRLSNEHSALQSEMARLEAKVVEFGSIEKKMAMLQKSLEEEESEKGEVQSELDRTSQRVKEMLESMEGVEREFNQRGDSLIELESQLGQSTECNIELQKKLNQYEDYAAKLHKDLERSMTLQKTLLQQVQDLETEGKEISEFMSEEKNALSECLREAEAELVRKRTEIQQLAAKISQIEEEKLHFAEVAEDTRKELSSMKQEISVLHTKAKDVLSHQDAELRTASDALNHMHEHLMALLEKILEELSISDKILEASSSTEFEDLPVSDSGTVLNLQQRINIVKCFQETFKNALLSNGNINMVVKETNGRNSPDGSEDNHIIHETMSSSSAFLEKISKVERLFAQILKVFCLMETDTHNIISKQEGEKNRMQQELKSQEEIIQHQKRDNEALLKSESQCRKQVLRTSRQLEIATECLQKFQDEAFDGQFKKLLEENGSLKSSLSHQVAMCQEKEKRLNELETNFENVQSQSSQMFISEAEHKRKMAERSEEIASLRQNVIERDHKILELNERHAKDLANSLESQFDIHQTNKQLMSTLDQILKNLESIPDVVSTCPTLQNIVSFLVMSPKSGLQNGFLNDCNANSSLPQLTTYACETQL